MSIARKPLPSAPFLLWSACVILLLVSVPAWPQPVAFVPGEDFRVDTPRPGTQVIGSPQASHALGISCSIAVWMLGGNHVAHAIWGRQICPGYIPPDRVLVRAPGKTILRLSLSSAWYHHALTWSTYDPVSGRREHFARIFDIDLNRVGPPFRIEIEPTAPGETVRVIDGPEIGIDDFGRVVIAWLESVDTEDHSFVRARARRYALDGTPGTEVLLGAASYGFSVALAVAPRGGAFMVAWELAQEDPAMTEIRLRIYDGDDMEKPVAAQPGEAPGACLRPAVETPALAAGYDRFFVAFAGAVGQSPDGVDPRCLGIFAQVHDLDGALVRGEFRVKRSSWSPVVRHDRSHFLVTWEAGPISGLPAPGGSPRPGTYLHPYASSGYSSGPELRVQEQAVTGIAFDPGRILLVWPGAAGVMGRFLERVL